MYYRRKIILAIIQKFGGKVMNTDLQKYLFLFVQGQEKPAYDFVPYKYGCFSFQSYADKRTLTKYGILADQDDWKKDDDVDYFSMLNPDDRRSLRKLIISYGNLKGNELINRVYCEYPYFAINSEILSSILSADQIAKVEEERPNDTKPGIYSIGYESKSFDHYLNQLVQNNIQMLVDVRKNALSMKYGFSKNQLRNALEKLNIEYLHIPELGITSNKRADLNTLDDYNRLFTEYENTVLQDEPDSLQKILSEFAKHKRVAITCFEYDHTYCHRSRVINRLIESSLTPFSVSYI
ncbi:MAG: DUF488 family protein [Candidatus Marinimicrobia bacterium]|nr:DUF488 family protein [Candidatus Neomarinimicrobiota bacterium]